MRSNLKIEKIDYRVNEEKRTVACILTCNMQLRTHPAYDMHFYYQWKKRMPKLGYNGEFTVSATAKCNEEDVFDVEIGKRIAESRAKQKAFGIAGRVYVEVFNEVVAAVGLINLSIDACASAFDVEEKHIKELIG